MTAHSSAPLPLLPLRDIVVFPGMVVPLFVGREKSVAALEAAMAGDKDIVLLAWTPDVTILRPMTSMTSAWWLRCCNC